jgi:hypothetical protein
VSSDPSSTGASGFETSITRRPDGPSATKARRLDQRDVGRAARRVESAERARCGGVRDVDDPQTGRTVGDVGGRPHDGDVGSVAGGVEGSDRERRARVGDIDDLEASRPAGEVGKLTDDRDRALQTRRVEGGDRDGRRSVGDVHDR